MAKALSRLKYIPLQYGFGFLSKINFSLANVAFLKNTSSIFNLYLSILAASGRGISPPLKNNFNNFC
jgi:hypothetical protein